MFDPILNFNEWLNMMFGVAGTLIELYIGPAILLLGLPLINIFTFIAGL